MSTKLNIRFWFAVESLVDTGVKITDAFGDSLLVVRQNKSEFHCFDGLLNSYLDRCLDIIKSLDTFTIHHIRREENSRANYLSQQASGYFVTRGRFLVLEAPTLDVAASKTDLLAIESVYGTTVCSSVQEGIMQANENSVQVPQMIELENNLQSEDWRVPLINYLKDLSQTRDRKIRRQALKYTLLNDELYRRTIDGLFLKCLDSDQSKIAMGEVHEGICGTHQSAHKMRWLLKRAGFYWPTLLEDCFRYYKGCEECQKFGNILLAPAAMLNPIIKPWPFRGWGLDFIGEIHPPSSRQHRFVLVATDYFTKWTEAVPLKI
jgi:hypothetical protein